MRAIINTIAAATVLIAGPALAETKPGTAALVAGSSQDEVAVKDKRYCVRFTVTGSRIAKKDCKTRAQWIDEDGFDPLAPEK
jgi:hypothetical protein